MLLYSPLLLLFSQSYCCSLTLILPSQSHFYQGMVATYDGGLAHMYLLLSCARRSSGACPPNLDMWKCQPEAKANSTLYNFSEDPWLNIF